MKEIVYASKEIIECWLEYGTVKDEDGKFYCANDCDTDGKPLEVCYNKQ